MRTWARITARAAVFTAGFVALGVTVIPPGASADSGGRAASSSVESAGSGNQVDAPVSAPVNACGGTVAIFGTADADCPRGTSVPDRSGPRTSGKHGIASGNQVNAPVSAPVNACGNAVAIFGAAEAGCGSGASVQDGSGGVTTGRNGAVAGNQVNAPVSVPVNICGNSVAILGRTVASCTGGAEVGNDGGGQSTSGDSGLGSGNQANAPVSAPISLCGNGAGHAVADCDGGATVRNGGQTSDGDSRVLGGNQANTPVSAPASACGDAAAILGEAGAFCDGGAHVRGASGGPRTSGTGGIGSGNQANAPSNAPSTLCGNIVTAPHHGATACDGTAIAGGEPGPRTSGDSSLGSGNQAGVPARAPASICGNAAAVTGHPEPVCEDGAGRRMPRVTKAFLINDATGGGGLPAAPEALRRVIAGTGPGDGTDSGAPSATGIDEIPVTLQRPGAVPRERSVARADGGAAKISRLPADWQIPATSQSPAASQVPAAGGGLPASGHPAVEPNVALERYVPARNVRGDVQVPAGIGQGVREGAVWALGLVAGVLALLRRLG
ncbi:chaplin family protein [Actinomadura sp. 9N407]|uniref:chaplin family protein n=1 Tax=Actinomadura sp. 9N407 TaxID=3375154 RepID=UPI0037893DC0